jgi:hypothetical protein
MPSGFIVVVGMVWLMASCQTDKQGVAIVIKSPRRDLISHNEGNAAVLPDDCIASR